MTNSLSLLVVEHLSLEAFEKYAATSRYLLIPVTGDCMEDVDINEGDFIAVDLMRKPLPIPKGQKDIALVYDERLDCVGVKEYWGACGSFQWVSTRYPFNNPNKPIRLNSMLRVSHVLGVVFACYDSNERLKWERDISDRPTMLSWEQGIKSGNVKMISGVTV